MYTAQKVVHTKVGHEDGKESQRHVEMIFQRT